MTKKVTPIKKKVVKKTIKKVLKKEVEPIVESMQLTINISQTEHITRFWEYTFDTKDYQNLQGLTESQIRKRIIENEADIEDENGCSLFDKTKETDFSDKCYDDVPNITLSNI